MKVVVYEFFCNVWMYSTYVNKCSPLNSAGITAWARFEWASNRVHPSVRDGSARPYLRLMAVLHVLGRLLEGHAWSQASSSDEDLLRVKGIRGYHSSLHRTGHLYIFQFVSTSMLHVRPL